MSWPTGATVFERVLMTLYPDETILITDGLDMYFEPVTVLHSNLLQGPPGPPGLPILTAPGGAQYQVGVDDLGNLTTTLIP